MPIFQIKDWLIVGYSYQTRHLKSPFLLIISLCIGLTIAVPVTAEPVERCEGILPGAAAIDDRGCPQKLVDIYAGLSFDDSDHREWYERFWSGDCGGLSFFQRVVCQNGDDFWDRTVEYVLQRNTASDKPLLRFRLWRLGRLVGHEWARQNSIRKIHTPDIQRWGQNLRDAPDLEDTLTAIEAKVKVMMAR